VLHKALTFPNGKQGISHECKLFMKDLLVKAESKRLGRRAGAADVKAHVFFRDLNWALLRNTTPPIIPAISGPYDTVNFRELEDTTNFDLGKELLIDGSDDANPFKDFESVSIRREE
jgi:hypothetical protein